MNASSLVSVWVRVVAAAAALLTLGVILACGDDADEELAPDTPSPTPEASPKTTPTPEPTTPPPATFSQDEAIVPGGYVFSYPDSWNLVVLSDNPYVAKFFLTPSPRLDTEEPSELAVFVYENPEQVALEEFFNGVERPNFFEDAVGGYRPFSAGGATGYWFDNVIGFAKSTVVALASDGIVYEFGDPDQKHQADGIFLEIVLSFRRI
jgi:hypothetical protein